MENENCFFFHRATEVRQHEFFKSNDWKLVELLKVRGLVSNTNTWCTLARTNCQRSLRVIFFEYGY